MASRERKKPIKRSRWRNEDIALPPSVLTFIEERSAVLDKELFEPMAHARLVEADADAKKRIEIQRRILKKLGILSEAEELHALASKRKHRST